MSIKTEEEKSQILEALLNEARDEADELRAQLRRSKAVIMSTRLIMGHELKKPTTAISGYLDLVCEDLEQSNTLTTLTYAEKARNECSLLTELNEFYMELLRSDDHDDRVGRPEVDLSTLVREIVAGFPGKYDARHRVQMRIANGVPGIEVNRNALKLIVMNLIENALLYSQTAAPVRVEVECVPDKRGMIEREVIKIRVIDSGIGIPEDYLKRIFSPFVRLREDVADGSGLGLTLVRSMVELNGGEVYIRSEHNKGTVVHVTLPVKYDADDEVVIRL